MKLWPRHFLLAAMLLAGCTRFQPRPLSADRTADQLETRSLTNAALRGFLEQNLRRDLSNWPEQNWDFEMLTLAAFYYHPSLDVARAQWAVAKGGETTAGQRPNPTLNVTPAYNVTTLTPSPWLPLGFLDVPIETAGKRRYRRAQAAQLSEAARLNVATIAWQVRGNLRASLVDFVAAGERQGRLEEQVALQEQIVGLLEAQVQAGAVAPSEAVTFRIALQKARLDLADVQRQRAEARARVAEAIGVPLRALDSPRLSVDFVKEESAARELTSIEARRAALLGRPDILGALAEYAAAQSALQLEIARQYPDVHLEPGYEFDQGDSKWSLGLTVELPVLSHNQGPIAEAKARRLEAAARFNALQAKVMADIDHAVEVFRVTARNSSALRTLTEEQAKHRDSVEAQFKAGAGERLDVLNARFEYVTAELVRLDGQLRLQQALSGLEDAVQRPLDSFQAIYQSQRTDAQ